MFKRVPAGTELEITQPFSSPGLRLEPHNHCVPLLDVIDLPRFRTFGEFVSFFTHSVT
jgi:hypothetical protein